MATMDSASSSAFANLAASSFIKQAPGAPTAHSDIFLKIETVEGESTDDKHKGEIEVLSYSWGASNPVSIGSGSGGLGAGRVSFSDISFMTAFGKQSIKLFQACAGGDHFKKATIVHRKSGKEQEEFLKYTLSDLMVSSIQSSTGSDHSIPTDSFTLAFAKIEVEYLGQDATGKVSSPIKAGFDIAANKKV
jgi:type VI secretion system secreted protein Hcp